MIADEIPFGDQIAIEQDRRKVQNLIDEGKITPEELQNAPIIEIRSPMIKFPEPTGPPNLSDPRNIKSITCNWQGDCGKVLKTLVEFEEHLALDHFGYTKTEQ